MDPDVWHLKYRSTEAALLSNMIDGTKRTCMQFKDVRSFLDSILAEDTHAKRVDSLASAALGVMTGASLAVAMISKSLRATETVGQFRLRQRMGRVEHCWRAWPDTRW